LEIYNELLINTKNGLDVLSTDIYSKE